MHGVRPRHRQHVVGSLPDVAEDLVRADAVGVEAGRRATGSSPCRPGDRRRLRCRSAPASGSGRRERLVHELEVGVEHRDVQGAAAPRRRARRRRRSRSATPSTSAGVDGGSDGWQAARRPAAHDASPPRRRGARAPPRRARAANAGGRRIERVEQRRVAVRRAARGRPWNALATVGRSPCAASSFQVRTPGSSALVERHAAVAAAGRVEVFEAVVADDDSRPA